MRILLTCHHQLYPDAGAPGLTLALGAAFERAGHQVDYYGFQHAFAKGEGEGVSRPLRFPWRVARFLRRRARDFDVIDATSGDAWVWASLRRPGHADRQALITRAHGLEHIAHEGRRRAAREGGEPLSWKYPIYHGGLRLWEVRRSLSRADHCVLYNSGDRDYARRRLGIRSERLSVMPNAIAPHFLEGADVGPVREGPVRLTFVGSWITRKGTRELVEVAERLRARGVDFSLAILGTGEGSKPLADFPQEAAARISVNPRYANQELPRLLEGREILVFPSHSEGSSVALLEAMACGLAPIATPAGASAEVIDDGTDGLLVEVGDAAGMASAIAALAGDRDRLERMRRAAQSKARRYRWERVAEQTVRLYERVLAETARSTG